MPDAAMSPRTAFASLAATSDRSSGVLVSDRDGLGLATVLARKQQRDAVAARVRERFGIELPRGPRRAAAGDVAFAGTGPGAWLATCEGGANAFAITLAQSLAGVASVSDQSDGYAVLRLSGPRVRDALGKLLAIDLHPSAFGPGDVAATVAAHIGVTFWRLDDDAGGVPVFEMAAFRSLADSLWHAIGEGAAEYGIAALSV